MKKILIFLISILFIAGCSCNKEESNTPKGEVQKLFSDYNSLSSDVLIQLDSVMENEDLTDSHKTRYKDILKRQYEDLKYEIKDEVITDENAIVTVEIEVYDLKKAVTESNTYIELNKKDFYSEGTEIINSVKEWDYKLDKMEKTTNRVKYTIDFSLTKIDNKWILDDLLESDRQKIHGLYTS